MASEREGITDALAAAADSSNIGTIELPDMASETARILVEMRPAVFAMAGAPTSSGAAERWFSSSKHVLTARSELSDNALNQTAMLRSYLQHCNVDNSYEAYVNQLMTQAQHLATIEMMHPLWTWQTIVEKLD